MAQTTNTSNSADYQSMLRSTTPSEDEDHFLTPSSDIDFSPLTGVVHHYSPVENNENDTDSISTEDLSQPTALMIPTYHNYSNLSASSSETSLARPLLSEKTHAIPLYTEDVKVTSPHKVTSSFQTNYCAFLKLYIADMFISAFAITPLVNIHWRGAWDLLDVCLLPDHPRISALVSLGTGLVILYVLYLTQSLLQGIYERNRKKALGHLLTRFYNLLMAFAYINQWRGLWNLLDMTSNHWQQLVIELAVSIVVLLFMKSACNLNSAPFLTATDTESCLLIGSKYTVSSKRFCQYTFDFVLYELVEAPFVVIAWRGLYNLSDLYLFSESKSLSMLVSFIVGYALFFLLALLQIPLIQCLMNKNHPHVHSILSHGSHLVAFVSVVQIWRSLWMMCEQYINIPGYHLLTLWLCYTLAYAVLTCGLAAWSLNGPGGAKEAYIDDQPIFLFKFDYFSTLLKNPSDHLAASGSNILGSDLSSTESIIAQECPYRFEPP